MTAENTGLPSMRLASLLAATLIWHAAPALADAEVFRFSGFVQIDARPARSVSAVLQPGESKVVDLGNGLQLELTAPNATDDKATTTVRFLDTASGVPAELHWFKSGNPPSVQREFTYALCGKHVTLQLFLPKTPFSCAQAAATDDETKPVVVRRPSWMAMQVTFEGCDFFFDPASRSAARHLTWGTFLRVCSPPKQVVADVPVRSETVVAYADCKAMQFVATQILGYAGTEGDGPLKSIYNTVFKDADFKTVVPSSLSDAMHRRLCGEPPFDDFSGTYRFTDPAVNSYLVITYIDGSGWDVKMSLDGGPLVPHRYAMSRPMLLARPEKLSETLEPPEVARDASCLTPWLGVATPLLCRVPANVEYRFAKSRPPDKLTTSKTGYVLRLGPPFRDVAPDRDLVRSP